MTWPRRSRLPRPADAVIVAAARTPLGRSKSGAFANVDVYDLARPIVQNLAMRVDSEAAPIDDVIFAESLQGGGVVARHVLLDLGLEHVPAMAINRHCAGSLAAIQVAASAVIAGSAETIVAGGVESLSHTLHEIRQHLESGTMPRAATSHSSGDLSTDLDMSLVVGHETARQAGIGRTEMDEWAKRSHDRALASIDAGLFDSEIVGIEVAGRPGCVLTDENPRSLSMEVLSQFPVLHPEIKGFEITALTSAGITDGAAGVLVMSSTRADHLGIRPLARVLSWANVAATPSQTGMTPIAAIVKAARSARVDIAEIGLFEINEAFASVPIAAVRQLGLNEDSVNVNGSGCSLGHPIAATGARMVVTMTSEMQRRNSRFGCVALCSGGGMGSALLLEGV
jgi:acetyl-CoA acetyltransferase family protein